LWRHILRTTNCMSWKPVTRNRDDCIFRVGQNHIYTVYIRYSWQGNQEIYDHIRCICTVLANTMFLIIISPWRILSTALQLLCAQAVSLPHTLPHTAVTSRKKNLNKRQMCKVGQNHIYTVYVRYFWQRNHLIYGHIRCIYTVLANPTNVEFLAGPIYCHGNLGLPRHYPTHKTKSDILARPTQLQCRYASGERHAHVA